MKGLGTLGCWTIAMWSIASSAVMAIGLPAFVIIKGQLLDFLWRFFFYCWHTSSKDISSCVSKGISHSELSIYTLRDGGKCLDGDETFVIILESFLGRSGSSEGFGGIWGSVRFFIVGDNREIAQSIKKKSVGGAIFELFAARVFDVFDKSGEWTSVGLGKLRCIVHAVST